MNNRQAELFWELLANPADKSYSHVQNLRQLAEEYPQSGLLHSLLLYAGEDDSLNHAAVYSDPRLLYKLRNDANSLHSITDAQLVKIAGENRYFHTDGVADGLKGAVEETLYQETAGVPLTEEAFRHEVPVDEYKPGEHFFEPETQQEEKSTAVQHDEEPLGYEDEIVPGFEETQNVIEEAYAHQAGETEDIIDTPTVEPVTELIAQADETKASHNRQPDDEALPESQIEQEIPLEETKQEPQFEQEIELPTPGFFVPSAASYDSGLYQGAGEDMYSKLYESYSETFEHTTPDTSQPIEDDVYNEIVGIDDINLAPQELTEAADEVPKPPPVDTPSAPKEDTLAKSRRVDLTDEAEKLMLSNIAATDFFVFDHALSERIKAGDESKQQFSPESVTAPVSTSAQTSPEVKQSLPKKAAYGRVTKYFDEKMPYSFMWWLDKTRKEHSGIYQPFVEFKLDTSQKIEKDVPDELQQQYYENIFELTSVDELERTTGSEPLKFDLRKKEDEIIERFIHETPQIKPQTSDKLDNENKAKRSSEDQDEIVTETLAQIYIDQMLYHKAIKVYQKLMLKFPEKRRYFAGQIEQLEKKII